MKLRAAAALALTACLATGGLAVTPVFEDFESADPAARWEFSNGPEFPGAAGEFRVTKPAARMGKAGGELRFDFSRGGNYVQASFASAPGQTVSEIRLWLKKSAPNRLTLRCEDSEGQTFQRGFNYRYAGWQEVHLPLEGWQTHWGGKNDGVFRGRPVRIGVIVENDGARTGSLYLDDISLIDEPSREAAPPSEYRVLDFGAGEQWSLATQGNAGSSRWAAPDLAYDFGGGATCVGIRTDIAIMGRPSRLTLAVESSSANASVRLHLAGHFQSFEKTLGSLSGQGRQEFVADLEGMPGWKHHGGADNGIPDMPLRVVGIYLDREEGTPAGQMRLISMTAVTAIPPEMGVVIVPSGALTKSVADFRCTLRNLLAQPVSGNLHWSVRDWAGREMSRGSRKVSIAAGESSLQHVTADGSGTFAECVFRFAAPGRTYGPVTTTVVRPLEPRSPTPLDADSPFGMGLYMYRAPDNESGRRDIEAKASLAATAGVKWSREEFQWHRVEPERGKFDFGFYDHLVDTARANGISVYGLIAYWSYWTKPYTMEGVEDYARYCKALVTHFKDRVKHWEVWNEPNIFF